MSHGDADATEFLTRAAESLSHGRPDDAEAFCRQAISAQEQAFGPRSAELACTLHELGDLYRTFGGYTTAQPLYERALRLFEQLDGDDSLDAANVLNNLAESLVPRGLYDRAAALHARARGIVERRLGLAPGCGPDDVAAVSHSPAGDEVPAEVKLIWQNA
jgi:tetratricopeptide (TPR) repeat protein